MIVLCCIVLSAVAFAFANPPCTFVEHPGKALSSRYSTFIDGVRTLQVCLDILSRSRRHEVVAFNHVTQECCGIPNSVSYELVEDIQWTAYTLSSMTTPVTSTTTEVASSTSTPVKATTTAGQAPTAPPTAGSATLVNSTTVDGITIAFYCDMNNHAYNITWEDAASICESIGWLPAQLQTEMLFNAQQNFDYHCGYPWVGARFNATSGAFEWTKSHTPVLPNFWIPGDPIQSYETYPFVASVINNYNGLYNDYGWGRNSFLCSSE